MSAVVASADPVNPKLTVGDGAVFAALWDSATVVKLDQTTLARVGSLQVGSRQSGPLSIAYGAGALWVPNFADGRLWRIDPTTMRSTLKIKLPGQASQVAVDDGSVWVTVCCTSTSTATRQKLLRIDPATGAITGRVTIPGDGETVNLSAAAESIVASSQNGPLTFIDPRTLVVQQRVSTTCDGCDSAPGVVTGSDSAYIATGTAVTRLALPTGRRLASP